MNFTSQKSNKMYTTLIHTNLLMVEYGQNKIEFSLFNLSHQDIIKQTQLQNSHLKSNNLTGYDKSLHEVFTDIQKNPEEIISFLDNLMTLKVRLSKKQIPLTFDLQLKQNKLAANQSICCIKQYMRCKDNFYKNEILKLKSKIYKLMTQVEDATSLIRSQSSQAKSSKQQIKSLKKQLHFLQDQKKKQQKKSFIEVGVQHSYSTQINDIIQCLQRPELKQFSFDEEKLRNLTQFIEQQIRQSQKIFIMASQALPKKQHQQKGFLSEPTIAFQTTQPQEPRVAFTPEKVYLFDKPNNRFAIDQYSLKTLQSV